MIEKGNLEKLDNIMSAVDGLGASDETKAEISHMIFVACSVTNNICTAMQTEEMVERLKDCTDLILKYKKFGDMAKQYDPSGSYRSVLKD